MTRPIRGELVYCGARTRSGGTCRRPAGWGTDHAGFGQCKLHGGSTTAGRVHGAKLRATSVVPVPISGFDAIEKGLSILNGIMVKLEEKLTEIDGGLFNGVDLHSTIRLARDAAKDLASVGKLAADAGLDERRLKLDEQKLAVLAATLRAVFADPELGLNESQQAIAGRVTARHLRELPT